MKMSATLTILFSLFLLFHSSNAFDITQILNNYPEFSTFNSYLTQYNLAAAINGRQTITVLVVDNGNLSPVSVYPPDVIRNILSVHVILDYYDLSKLQQLASGSSLLTTLFQATGLAKGQQGFLNVTRMAAGSVTFSSAMPGSAQGSSLVKLVMSDPYNLSILHVSSAIIPQGIDGSKTSSPPSKSPSTPSATPPPPPPPAPTTVTPPPPAPATATAPTKSSMAPPPPTATTTAPPPTTSKGMAPSSSTPTSSQTPSASPGSVTEPGTLAPESPTRDVPVGAVGDTPAFKSAAITVEIGLALVCTMALSTLYLGSRI